MNKCLQCGKETKNLKFCSRSCSASYNNRRRKKQKYYCEKCGQLIGEGQNFSRRKFCNKCNPNNVDWNNITLKQVKEKRKYQPHSRIRDLARKKALQYNRFYQCSNCGYNKHVEVCHIKSIDSFNEDSCIGEINSLSNLVGLCPNCHWEFDHGLLPFNPEWINNTSPSSKG